MAKFTITIPDDKVSEIVQAISDRTGWTATILDENGNEIPNPETRAQWSKRQIRDYIKNLYRKWKAQQARAALDVEAAEQAAIDEAEAVPITVT